MKHAGNKKSLVCQETFEEWIISQAWRDSVFNKFNKTITQTLIEFS